MMEFLRAGVATTAARETIMFGYLWWSIGHLRPFDLTILATWLVVLCFCGIVNGSVFFFGRENVFDGVLQPLHNVAGVLQRLKR